MPVGLGRERAQKIFTYYPSMPGNATTRPAEKAALQQGSMRPSFFQGARELACKVLSLEELMADQGIERIDLLKVSLEEASKQHLAPRLAVMLLCKD